MVITYLKDMPSTRRFAILIIVAAASLSAYNLLQRYYGLDAQIATCFDNDRPRPTRILNCSKLIERDDASGNILHRLLTERALIYRNVNQDEMAFADIDQAAQLQPNNATTWTQRGYINNDRGEHEIAEADFDKALELSPKNKWTLSWRARGLHDRDESIKALAVLEEILDISPNDLFALHRKAHNLEDLGRMDDARDVLEQAVVANPDNKRAYERQISFHNRREEYDEALAMYLNALLLWPEDATFNLRVGEIYLKVENDYDTALDYFLRAEERSQNNYAVWLYGAATYFRLDQDQRGKEYIQKYVNFTLAETGWWAWLADQALTNGTLKNRLTAMSYAGAGRLKLAMEEAKKFTEGGGVLSMKILKDTLIEKGFYEGSSWGEYDDETHIALIAYFESLNFIDK